VPSSHRTCENPEALAEVKRILKLHLAEMKRGEAAPNRRERSSSRRESAQTSALAREQWNAREKK
jgi:hypothetical protein